jgi:hypothetical protein
VLQLEHQYSRFEEARMASAGNRGGAGRRVQSYRCFLLRCRLEEGGGQPCQPAWRFTVQQTGSGASRRSFSRLKDVEAYLEAELASVAGAIGSEDSNPGQIAGEQKLA